MAPAGNRFNVEITAQTFCQLEYSGPDTLQVDDESGHRATASEALSDRAHQRDRSWPPGTPSGD